MYSVVTDDHVQHQVEALPHDALDSFAELRVVLEVNPWSGDSVNANNPDGPVRTLTFGHGLGLVTYLILEDQRRVDLLIVQWVG